MTLQRRLARLERHSIGRQEAPGVILFNACWRGEGDALHSIAKWANVRTATGWCHVQRDPAETEAAFRARLAAMAE
ncbi:MAG TPA: hypothetical protein PKC84_02120 [Paracoccaceae bacterium]|nr:hypothetical protein [Paracoccaceae bacterium]